MEKKKIVFIEKQGKSQKNLDYAICYIDVNGPIPARIFLFGNDALSVKVGDLVSFVVVADTKHENAASLRWSLSK